MRAKRTFNLPRATKPLLVLLAFGLLAVALVAPSPKTSSYQAQSPSLQFAVIGDFGSGDSNEQDVANLVKSWNPEFIVTVGDNNYPDGEWSTIDANIGQFFQEFIYPYVGSYGPGATVNRFFPALGNHDWHTGSVQPHLDYFTLPNNERYYDFVWGPVHLFAIDSDPHEPDGITADSAQANWLKSRLTASTARWKIVYFHHPPYSSRLSTTQLQWPFKEWGADAVLAGHAHVYERIMRNGFPYFTNGLGGDSLGSFDTSIEGSVVQFGSDYGAMRVNASDQSITFEFITRAGLLIDTYMINAAPAAPVAPSLLNANTISGNQIDLTWVDNSSDENGFKIERSTDGINFTQIANLGANINVFSSSGLSPSTTYYYRVRAYNTGWNSGYSNTGSATTLTAVTRPAAPSNLTATGITTSRVSLAWTDNSANEDGFKVYRSTTGSSFTLIATAGVDTTAFTDTGRTNSTTYYYRVRAFNAAGDSADSNTAAGTTLANIAAPTNLAATAASSSQINLTWADNSTTEGGFKIERSADGTGFTEIATVGANTTTYSNTGLVASTTYYYRVRAFISTSNSGYSNTATATTQAGSTVPAAPTNLTATAVSSSQINLVWSDNSASEQGFKIFRSTDGATFTQAATVGANTTAYEDTGRAAATTYQYRVRAYDGSGESADSNTASATTQSGTISAPSNLTATAVSNSQINLAWTDNSSDEIGFKIERSTDGTSFTQIATVGANTSSFASTGLIAATTYYYRARAYNASLDSGYSNTASATTQAGSTVPAAPTNLTATAVSRSRISLAWTDNSANETGFKVYRSTTGNTFTLIATVGANTTAFIDTGRTARTTYYYRVRAYNSAGDSVASNTASATTFK